MKLSNIYSVPKFKQLDKTGKAIFFLSFLIPIIIVYVPIHLYFLPFGLNKNYNLDSKEVSFLNKEFFYEVEGEELLDGTATIQIQPHTPKRTLMTYIEAEGENVFIQRYIILDEEIIFEPTYEQEFEDFDYLLLNNYEVEEKDYIVFKIDYELDPKKEYHNEIILKYKNLSIIQNTNSVELRVIEKTPNSLNTYKTSLQVLPTEDEKDNEVTIYAIYKKPNKSNGFLEILADNHLSGRTIIPSEERNEILGTEIIWHPDVESDISQKYISLKDEEYTRNLFLQNEKELNEILQLEKEIANLNSITFSQEGEVKNFAQRKTARLKEQIENLQTKINIQEMLAEEEFHSLDDKKVQNFYKKEFVKTFDEKIHKLSIGYEYPIIQKKDFFEIYPETPFSVTIVGENSKIEKIKINLFRKPLWEKF